MVKPRRRNTSSHARIAPEPVLNRGRQCCQREGGCDSVTTGTSKGRVYHQRKTRTANFAAVNTKEDEMIIEATEDFHLLGTDLKVQAGNHYRAEHASNQPNWEKRKSVFAQVAGGFFLLHEGEYKIIKEDEK